MGTWSLPKSNVEFENLLDLMSKPIPARTAQDQLYQILGDDDLFDNIERAKKADQEADVRSLIVNRIWQIYLTGQAPSTIVSEPLSDRLMSTISKPIESSDVFNQIIAIKDREAAKQQVMWACDAQPEEADKFISKREPNQMDYIVTDGDERVFRVEAISKVVCEIDLDNIDLYGVERQIKLQF